MGENINPVVISDNDVFEKIDELNEAALRLVRRLEWLTSTMLGHPFIIPENDSEPQYIPGVLYTVELRSQYVIDRIRSAESELFYLTKKLTTEIYVDRNFGPRTTIGQNS